MDLKYVLSCVGAGVLLGGGSLGIVWASGAPFSWVWAAGLPLLAAAFVGGVALLLETQVWRPLRGLRFAIRDIERNGDLSLRVELSGFGVAQTAARFNALMESFQGIVGKVIFSSRLVGAAAEQMLKEARSVVQGSEQQAEAVDACSLAVEEMTRGMVSIEDITHQTATNASQSKALSVQGGELTGRLASEIERIAASVQASAEVIAKLGERSKAISGITDAIRDIADQTNLLALNAAIEAARAGEQGRGFAVVADEVRSLAERTAKATGEITDMIRSIQDDTKAAIASVHAGSQQARSGADLARQAAVALSEINQGSENTLAKAADVATAIAEHRREADGFADHVRGILTMVNRNREVAANSLREAGYLEHLANNLKEIGNVFKLGNVGESAIKTHERMPDIVKEGARRVGEALENAVARGRISESDLFDEKYQPIANTNPQKFTTRFDKLTDEIFTPIQEALLDRHTELAYAIGTDRKGYVPTHNQRFSKPLTGDPAKDLAGNRTKRVFDDPVGRRCGAHAMPFLVQTYRRDTGEIMHDISSPVFVRGRQWGGFRMGYKA